MNTSGGSPGEVPFNIFQMISPFDYFIIRHQVLEARILFLAEMICSLAGLQGLLLRN